MSATWRSLLDRPVLYDDDENPGGDLVYQDVRAHFPAGDTLHVKHVLKFADHKLLVNSGNTAYIELFKKYQDLRYHFKAAQGEVEGFKFVFDRIIPPTEKGKGKENQLPNGNKPLASSTIISRRSKRAADSTPSTSKARSLKRRA